MEEKKEIFIGNLTTIITTISLTFAGLIISVLASLDLNLGLDQTTLAGTIGTILMFCFSVINAKFKNTYFDTEEDVIKIDVTNLTSAQVDSINNFVTEASKINNTTNNEDEEGGC